MRHCQSKNIYLFSSYPCVVSLAGYRIQLPIHKHNNNHNKNNFLRIVNMFLHCLFCFPFSYWEEKYHFYVVVFLLGMIYFSSWKLLEFFSLLPVYGCFMMKHNAMSLFSFHCTGSLLDSVFQKTQILLL